MTERDGRLSELRDLMWHGEVWVRDYDMMTPNGREGAARWLLSRLDRAHGELHAENNYD